MCGIAGWFAAPGARIEREVLRAMSASIAHRGPDDRGDYLDEEEGVGLVHRRLAILDLSAGSRQPMIDDERGIVLLYNGELYNFRDLRAELEAAGERFRTTGDTEVVLRAFGAWGERCFERFAGMFAVAIWERRARRLWLARDPTGMKPLYLLPSPGRGLLFASELKALLHAPGFEPAVEPRALRQYLELGYTFLDDGTILRGVSKLLPGEVLEAREGRVVSRRRYFEPPRPDPADRRPPVERAEELHQLLGRVVREHLVSDVPLGLLLSGGVDSSFVAALAAREGLLTTVTMAFARSGIDERPAARRVAEALGTTHLELEIEPAEVVGSIVRDAAIFDDLFADWGAISTRVLYRKFRELGLRVALVGEGADELLGGYPVFETASGPASTAALFRLYRRYAGRRWGRLFGEFRGVMRELLAESGGDLFDAVRRFEAIRQLPNNYVMKVDKASMSVSLEARAPFLDRRVAELAWRTPRELLLREGENKWLLREAARRSGLLPAATTGRAKFGAAIATNWLDEEPALRELAREVVLDPAGWCDRLGLRRAMERYFAGAKGYPFPHSISIFRNLAWRLLLLNLWSVHYLRRPPWPAEGLEAAAASVASEPRPVRQPDLVSVVVPARDRPSMVPEAVASVLADPHRPVEVLLVDDASTDHTREVAAALAARHPEVVVVAGPGLGPGPAREAGRVRARGEFVLYLDSDDLVVAGSIARRVAGLRSRPEAIAAYGASEVLALDGAVHLDPERPSNTTLERMFPAFLSGRFWNTGAALLRAAAADEAGAWSALRLEEDWEYDARLAVAGRPLVFVPGPAVRVRRLGHRQAGSGEPLDPARLREQARAHERILAHARRAEVDPSDANSTRFARSLFFLARRCGAAGLHSEAARLLALAREAAYAGGRRGPDLAAYATLVRIVGPGAAGRLAESCVRWRD